MFPYWKKVVVGKNKFFEKNLPATRKCSEVISMINKLLDDHYHQKSDRSEPDESDSDESDSDES